MHKYICQNCGEELHSNTALYWLASVNCGACSKGFFIPWTEAERRHHDLADQVYATLQEAGIDPATMKVESFSFGDVAGRHVVATSWKGVAQPDGI